MQPRRRRSVPPWERQSAHPRHSTGRTRRRWPEAYTRAYDGPPPVKRRYRRAFDGDQRTERRRARLPSLEDLRRSPIRNGLIGLAVAGTAAPLAVNRYQDAMRHDPSHERALTQSMDVPLDDAAVSNAWAAMEAETGVATEAELRDRAILEKMEEFADYDVTRDLAEDIYDAAVANDVDPDVAFGLVRAESSFKNTSTSRVGAMGLTQLMPKTATWLEPGLQLSELRNPETNLRIGMKYLRQLMDKYDGDVALALTAYNRGPGTVDRALKRGQNPDNGYADFVYTGEKGAHKG